MDINSYIKNWSEKLSIPISDIEKDYNNLLLEENEIHKDLGEEDRKQRALQRLALVYKKQLRSPAVGFEGIIIGVGDAIDIVAKQRKTATDMFKNNPQQAVTQGFTDEDGTPLDVRSEWSTGKANPNFGKPLPEHNWLRNIYGIVVKSKIPNDTPKFFSMSLSGDKATNDNIPVFTPVRFMAIDRTPEDMQNKVYTLNASTFTNINVDKNLNLPEFDKLIKNCCNEMFVQIKDLVEYHAHTKDDFNRLVITEGSVSSLNLEPTTFGSRIMTVEDEMASLDDIEKNTGVTCWIPDRVDLDFAEGSKVIVVGRTAQGKKKDDQGNVTEELGDVSINAFGVFAIPSFKILLPENIEEITEETI